MIQTSCPKFLVSRVDVSETFSADQLWFRIISDLFQFCSLPENLSTALKTKNFRVKNQRSFSLKQRWFWTDTEWQFLVYVAIFFKCLKVPQVSGTKFSFSAQFVTIRELQKVGYSILLRFKHITKTRIGGFFCYCSGNKTDIVQIFRSIFLIFEMKFQNYSKKMSFCCQFAEYWGKLHFF